MSKRRAEDKLLLDSPSKRCCRTLYSVDMGSVVPAEGMSPPSLLALLCSRSRKRPHYFENPEEQEDETVGYRKAATHHSDTRKHAVSSVTPLTSGSFQDRRSFSPLMSSKKQARVDCACSKTSIAEVTDTGDGDTSTEDSTYNSFQYWRAPLPELDLSLLDDADDHPQAKDVSKVNDSSSYAMET